jgi:iron complex outermembrane receptor protein
MQGRYTRFLADGLPLFGQQGGGLGLLQIPPMDLGQVEVIKGVSSALYGGGAMAGVVNLIARRPADEPIRDLLFNRSTLGTTDALAFLAMPGGRTWSMSSLMGGHWQESRDLDEDGWADVAEYERGVARPRLYWKGGEASSGFLTGGLIYENRNGGTMAGAALPATGAPYLESLRTRRYDVGGNVQALAGGKYVLTARGAASWQNHDHRFGEVRERDRHEMAFGELSARGSAGRNTWVAGVAAERESYVPKDVQRFAYTYTTPGVFVQDDIDIAAWVSVSASARVDFHSRYGTILSPRVSALMRAKGWTSRVSAGEGFFAPTPLTEETEAAGLARLETPYGLLAERGRSASVDVSRAVGPVTATVTVFGSRVRNPVYVERGTRYALYNLEQPVSNAGMELLGILRKSPWSVSASYMYVQSRQEVEGVRGDVPLTPRQSFGTVAVWEKKDVGRVGLEFYVTGRQRLEENPYRAWSEPYVLVGALVEKKVGPVRFYFNAENIANVRQTRWDPLVRPTRAVDGRWTVDAWSPLDGRVFNGGVRWRW